jgi:hypothetical protein
VTATDLVQSLTGAGLFLIAYAMYRGASSPMARDVRLILGAFVLVYALTVVAVVVTWQGWADLSMAGVSRVRSWLFQGIAVAVIGHRIVVWTRNGSRSTL